MRSVSLSQALEGLLLVEHQEKTAEISTSPRTFFVHVRVPEHVAEDLRAVQRKVLPDTSQHAEIDHVTAVYTRKPPEDHPPEKVHAALEALRQVGANAEPITGRIQGWAYFDNASKDGKTNTALVALLDAPGLEHLHVDMSRALKAVGMDPSALHSYTPHITLGYIGDKGRVEGDLPPLNGRFTIDKIHVASRDHHEIPLSGVASRLGQKAARDAMPAREVEHGMAEETKEHHLDPDTTAKLVTDHLSKTPDYYAKESKLGREAAEFAMNPRDIRSQPNDAPGKGQTSPSMGGVPLQGRR